MLWECSGSMPMQSVLPQCPDGNADVSADVENAPRQARRRTSIQGGNWTTTTTTQQQQQCRHSSSTTKADLTTNTRDLEAHLPIPMAMERSSSLGGISWYDLCLYPDDDDDEPEIQQQPQKIDNVEKDNDNDECLSCANDNDGFSDNHQPSIRTSSSFFASKHRKKIMLWIATFGLIAVVVIALAIGMSVRKNSLTNQAQLEASENAALEDNKDTIPTTYHPTYSPTILFRRTESPVTTSSSPVTTSVTLSSRPSNNNNNNVAASGANTEVAMEQNDTSTSNPVTPTQVSPETPTLQPSSVLLASISGGEGEESIPIETIQFMTTVPTQQLSASPTSSSLTSMPSSSSSSPSASPSYSTAQSSNWDLVSSGKGSSSASTQSHLSIELQTDQHGEETSWTLHLVNEQTGSVSKLIASVDENVYQPHEQDSIELYLDPGKYRFTLKDAFGDGFCCSNGSNGYYVIHLDGTEIINGGYYRFEQSYDILVGYDPELTMSERDREWVEAHNVRRKDWHERNGETYVPLVWSVELAKAALDWAQVLVENCDEETWHEPSVSEGENLAQNIGSSGSSYGQLYPPENILKRWVEREESVKYPGNLHLTQALWRASRYLGCGDAVKNNDDGSVCRVQVCRYIRTGNCNMGSYNPKVGNNWLIPMLMEQSKCGPECPPEGCF